VTSSAAARSDVDLFAIVWRQPRDNAMQMKPQPKPQLTPPSIEATVFARILRHDAELALTTLFIGDGELRVPQIDMPVDSAVQLRIDARDVSIALSRPMDVSITNRLPGEIVELEYLAPPYVCATFDLGTTRIHSLIIRESVDRLALVRGLRAWVMIKAVAISERDFTPDCAPRPRPWPLGRTTSRETS
jgi:molybdate transport system ATP-binding protein